MSYASCSIDILVHVACEETWVRRDRAVPRAPLHSARSEGGCTCKKLRIYIFRFVGSPGSPLPLNLAVVAYENSTSPCKTSALCGIRRCRGCANSFRIRPLCVLIYVSILFRGNLPASDAVSIDEVRLVQRSVLADSMEQTEKEAHATATRKAFYV